MTFLEYAKEYHNFDVFLVLVDNAGYTNEEIMEKFDVSKTRIYNAKTRLAPILKMLETAEPPRKDMRNKDVQTIIEAFTKAFGTTKVSAPDRWAAKRLHVKYGADEVAKVIQALASRGGDQFAPVVNSVSELENKWVSVGKFLSNQTTRGMIEL